jgi:hypothetical protein
VLFGIIALTSIDANALGRGRGRYNDRRWDDRGYNNDRWDDDDDRYNGRDRRGNQSLRFAYQRGYREGLQQGRRDARRYRGSYGNYGGYGNYRNGNRRGWGNNSDWQRAYQRGFERGYREGLNRNRNRRNNGSIFGF